jgi:hypothetical protein
MSSRESMLVFYRKERTVVDEQTLLAFVRLFLKVLKEQGHLLRLETEGNLLRFLIIGERNIWYCPITLTSNFLNETRYSSLSCRDASASLGMGRDLTRLVMGASDNVETYQKYKNILLSISRRYVLSRPT